MAISINYAILDSPSTLLALKVLFYCRRWLWFSKCIHFIAIVYKLEAFAVTSGLSSLYGDISRRFDYSSISSRSLDDIVNF